MLGFKLVDAFCPPSLAQPCALQKSFRLFFIAKLEKLARNFFERCRYGAHRLALRQARQKSSHNLKPRIP
ncbi:MAG: hypothetical protein MR481_01180 [Campylobacter sp.]|uniref:hypothetical protein n=1 Tax=Campylobacter sp. TaxID=205 RepID=UPI002AA66701|nr:hypothetical protein [Campylobacter sp.]MCI7246528.1 hypothetical protein [Campylobacter sp.]